MTPVLHACLTVLEALSWYYFSLILYFLLREFLGNTE